MKEKFVEVVLPLPLRGPLVYRLPQSLETKARPGSLVQVPLGPRRLTGCLLSETKTAPPFRTKEILEVFDTDPVLSTSQLKLLKWASAYYLTPLGEVLRHLLPPRFFRQKESKEGDSFQKDSSPTPPEPLNPAQESVLETILNEQRSPQPLPILLHGITGSGKTEVYIETIRKVLLEGGQALVLVPEIGLTPQIVGRFRGRLCGLGKIDVYHSGLTPNERFKVWKGAREGKIAVLIATRSGIFLRFPNLKIIVIDEEHDPSYKQEERFCYHARDLALWRGREEKIQILMGSATPSLESLYRAQQGKVKLLRLSERPGGINLPFVETIDRRTPSHKEKGDPIFSAPLLEGLRENLKRGEQSLLFLNRRGYSPFILCPQCGFVPRCNDCDISLTVHKQIKGGPSTSSGPPLLVCHYCDAVQVQPTRCSHCGGESMIPFGFGTERIAQELHRHFPHARIARMDRDASRGKAWMSILEKMKKREIDILVGTQMITKGHDYPFLTLVGVIDADLALNLPDFRAAERTFQVITQVAGRAGRGERPGRVLIQTYQPSHEGLRAAANHDGDRFYAKELEERREAGYPPFKRLIEIQLAGKRREVIIEKSRLLARKIRKRLPREEGTLLGPAPCPVEKVRGRSRWRLLIKTSQYARVQPQLSRLLDDFAENDLPSSTRMLVNVDPVEMM